MTCEKFREWKYRKTLMVTYKDATGKSKVFEKNQAELLEQVNSIVSEYVEQNIKLTNRQLYYQLVARGYIPNADKIYKRICKFLTDARYAGLINWDAIEDRGRIPKKSSEWKNIKDIIETAIYSYRLPRLQDQDHYIELYCEKQALESVLWPVASKYHIIFGYNKGYSSASSIYDLAERVRSKIRSGKEVKILYVGDHDPSGLDMVRDVNDRVYEFLTGGDTPVKPRFEVISLALTMDQIMLYNPPPNPAKITDPRAKWYISKYGETSWELDAIKPEVLVEIVEKGIENYFDMEKYNAWIDLENGQKKKLEKFCNEL